MSTQYNQLYRPRQGRLLGGVCAGLGEYLEIDPTVVRLGFIFASMIGWLGAMVLIYLIMWVVVPESPNTLIEKPGATPSPTADV